MKKEYIKYGSITFIVLFILAFIYPTIYRYDKLNQKIPVRINRITGGAELLYLNGWEKAEQPKAEVPKLSEMEQFKIEMDNKFNQLKKDEEARFSGMKQQIEKDASDTLKTQVTQSIKDDIAKAKSEISDYKNAELDPSNSFTKGSTMDEVRKIMGIPTSTSQASYLQEETWSYKYSTVKFKSGKVVEWNNSSNNLRLK